MDTIGPAARSRVMASIRSTDTGPELVVRRLVHRSGYRYRLHKRDLPGKPDLAFPGRRKVIFVHGCFWHQHRGCRLNHQPKSRADYWGPKLLGNRRRDSANLRRLARSGWRAAVVWECETEAPTKLIKRIKAFLGPR